MSAVKILLAFLLVACVVAALGLYEARNATKRSEARKGEHYKVCREEAAKSEKNSKTTAAMLEFAVTDDADFPKLPEKPEPGDWLDRFKEEGQTFEDYVAASPRRPTEERNKIIIQPIGEFTEREKKMLELLREYCSIVFACETTLADAEKMPADAPHREREWNGRKYTQYRTGYLLDRFLRPRLPKDALCMLGVTMADLYPDDSWNYVFGQASLRERVGVYSLVRFFAQFWNEEDTEERQTRALLRSLKTLAHEVGHMFTINHCIAYQCLMNGANSLNEQDGRPIHECPVCLKKLQWNTGFDVVARYEKLQAFYATNGLKPEADWVANRLKRIAEHGK
jgi:archaemetzincin